MNVLQFSATAFIHIFTVRSQCTWEVTEDSLQEISDTMQFLHLV